MAEEKKEKKAKIDQAQQEKLRAKITTTEQDDEIKEESPQVLRTKLTNKNSDYVFRLQKELEKQGKLSHSEAEEKVNQLLPEIIVAQRHGQPANGLYMASPKIKADQILHPEVKPKTLSDFPFWQRAVDSGLLWLAIFMGIYGLMGLASTKPTGQNGVLTITIVGILLGVFLAKYNDLIMPRDQNGKPKKVSWPRVIVVSVALVIVIVILMGILTLKALRPINPVLPGIIYIIIAAISFGIRYLFRKQYGITGSTFMPAPPKKSNK